jgi:hypothetical protein
MTLLTAITCMAACSSPEPVKPAAQSSTATSAAASAAPSAPSTTAALPPIPDSAREGVQFAMLLGKLIHRQDGWAARASDRLLQEHILEKDDRLRGWVITHDETGGTVHFIGAAGPGLAVLYRVVFPGYAASGERIERVDSPAPLTGALSAQFKAREAALHSSFKRFTKDVNIVALPASLVGKEGWLVYLLAATSNPGEILLGGHTRCHVSEDGERVLSVEPLSAAILRLPIDAQVEAVTHRITDFPLETHVFASLLYRRIIPVITASGLWEVNGTDIVYRGPVH